MDGVWGWAGWWVAGTTAWWGWAVPCRVASGPSPLLPQQALDVAWRLGSVLSSVIV